MSPSPQPPARQKTEGGEAGDSGTETTPSGRSFQMALEEVSDGPTNWVWLLGFYNYNLEGEFSESTWVRVSREL